MSINQLKLQDRYSSLTEYGTDKIKEDKEAVIEFFTELKYTVSTLCENVEVLFNSTLTEGQGLKEFFIFYSKADSFETDIRKTINYVCEQFESANFNWTTYIDMLLQLKKIEGKLSEFFITLEDCKPVCLQHINEINGMFSSGLSITPELIEKEKKWGNGIIEVMRCVTNTLENYREDLRFMVGDYTEEEETQFHEEHLEKIRDWQSAVLPIAS